MGFRVLVVDDQEDFRLAAQSLLKEFGVDIHLAEDGAQAVELCNQKGFNLIFMDVHMPGMDGFETVSAIRKSNFGDEIVIYGLTSDDSIEVKKKCAEVGMANFIKKPLRFEDFQRVILKHRG